MTDLKNVHYKLINLSIVECSEKQTKCRAYSVGKVTTYSTLQQVVYIVTEALQELA
jgi:hypothetical protein